jgi:hypothetical protein
LLITVEQEKCLVLKRIGLPRLIKLWQKRIIFDALEQGSSLKLIGEHLGQTALADADWPLDYNVLSIAHASLRI